MNYNPLHWICPNFQTFITDGEAYLSIFYLPNTARTYFVNSP